jgi:hypothetical protein
LSEIIPDPTTPEPDIPEQNTPEHIPEPPILSQPEPPAHGLPWVFLGKNGLIRAGWGILIFVLILVAAGFTVSFLFQHFSHPPADRNMPFTPRLGLIMEGVQVLMVVIATGAMALIERKSLFAYGYQGKARAIRFISGLIWGFVAISALVFALWKAHLLAFDPQALHGAEIWKNAALWALVFIGTGIFEESTLRGYVQFTMARGVGFWWGALLFSFLFGFAHGTNPGETPVGLFAAGAIGLIFCLSIWYTGSLWWAVGFHASWDWGESYFYGTSNSGLVAQGHLFSEHPTGKLLWSGGATGPEGSLLIIPLLLLIALFIWLWWRNGVQSPFADSGWRPAWSKAGAESR